jgi:hypothetical protein
VLRESVCVWRQEKLLLELKSKLAFAEEEARKGTHPSRNRQSADGSVMSDESPLMSGSNPTTAEDKSKSTGKVHLPRELKVCCGGCCHRRRRYGCCCSRADRTLCGS